MENKCFSCDAPVPNVQNDENADIYLYINELITYCVPEVENTDFDFSANVCTKCIEVLEGYTKFKGKCLDLQKQFEHLQDIPNLSEVDAVDAIEDETKAQPPDVYLEADDDEDTQEETVIIEIINDDQEDDLMMLDVPEEQEDEVTEQTTTEAIEVQATPEGNRYKCPRCKTTLKSIRLLNCHIKMIHETEKKLECATCSLKFKTKFSLTSHERIHSDVRPHICQFCGKGFKNKRVLHLHEVRHSDVRAFKCAKWPECKSTFKTRNEATSHLSVHSQEKRFVCAVCNLKLKTKYGLTLHARVHEQREDDVAQHVCRVCNKSYKSQYNLSLHEALHVDLREFKCEVPDCPKAFNTKGELKKHNMAAHTSPSEWKYQCDNCDCRFPQKSTFDRHVKTHTNERPFDCHLCEYKTFTNRELRDHLNVHEGIKPFNCFRCSARYRNKFSLQTHLWEQHHIGVGCNDDDLPIKLIERNFACLHCDKKYSDSVRLRNHMKAKHPEVVDNGDNKLKLENVAIL